MSDKLQEDFNIYCLELKNFTENFKTSSQAVETDKLLSRAGKFEQVEKIKVEHLKSVSDLSERFTADFGKRLENLDDRVTGKKHDPVLDAIKKKFSKGESLSGASKLWSFPFFMSWHYWHSLSILLLCQSDFYTLRFFWRAT